MPRRSRTNTHSSPSLEFGASSGAYVGFVATEADRESATEELVIRELIQNALDAAAGKATVLFKEIVMPAGELPCIDDYTAAFEAARQHRVSRPDAVISPNERQITDRIAEALQGDVRVLVCADSGSGISADALRRLYNCGDTAKNVGRGSVGVGHLIPFTVSDLRYVLYAGRTASGETTFGGHAIVATHLRPRRRRKPSNTQRDSHGYVRGSQEDLRIAASAATGDAAIPATLSGWLPDTPTGSAVGIVAYNPPRRRPRGTATERLLREAAKSFVVAVHDGNLTVEASTDGGEGTLDAQTLRDTLAGCRAEKTRLRSKGVAGATAWDAYNTLIGGEHIDATFLPPGVRAWTRELPPGARTRVVFCREGMWISDNVNYNKPADFTGKRPFFAVVDVSPPAGGGLLSLCALVRDGEGTSHWHVTPGELTDPHQRQALTDGLLTIAGTLRSHATDSKRTRIEPNMLRIFPGEATSALAAMPAPPADGPDGDGEPSSDTADQVHAPRLAGDPVDVHGPQSDHTAPPSGSTTGIRTACRHISGTKVAVAWQADAFHRGDAGLRILSPSGADATCERPTRVTYLPIEAVAAPGSTTVGAISPGEARLRHPSLRGAATVLLARPPHPDEAPYLEAELVHRRAEPAGGAR